MILHYLLIFLFFNLIKTAAKFLHTESVKCPAYAVIDMSRARHMHLISLNLLTSRNSPLIMPRQSRRDIILASSVCPSVHSVRPHFLSVRKHISLPINQI